MQRHAKSVAIEIGTQKKAPIWDLFFASQFLWPQHFLHGVKMINMDNFNWFNYKKLRKTIDSVLWIYIIANYFEISEFSQHTIKAKKAPIWEDFFDRI